jgi:hypothetical protein
MPAPPIRLVIPNRAEGAVRNLLFVAERQERGKSVGTPVVRVPHSSRSLCARSGVVS